MRRALPAGRSTSLPAGNREMGRLLGPFPRPLCCLLAAGTVLAAGDASPAAGLGAVRAQSSR